MNTDEKIDHVVTTLDKLIGFVELAILNLSEPDSMSDSDRHHLDEALKELPAMRDNLRRLRT